MYAAGVINMRFGHGVGKKQRRLTLYPSKTNSLSVRMPLLFFALQSRRMRRS